MNGLKISDTGRSFLFGLADLISRYDNVTFEYMTDDDGIHISVNDEEVFVGFMNNIETIELHKAANK